VTRSSYMPSSPNAIAADAIRSDRENSEKPNIAEILIEKHRNGETGKIELYFNDKKATFQSIDRSGYGGTEKELESF